MTSTRIFIRTDLFRNEYQLIPFRDSPGHRAIATKIEFYSYPIDECPPSHEAVGITIDQIGAQSLMDSLWDAGLRPTKGSGSAGSFEAQGRHLEDMRQLVFKAVDQEAPK
jgi:hypothetical protein